MIEILLTDLNQSDFYEKTLQTIENVCEDYAIEKEFGTLSMANQMVGDYLTDHLPNFTLDVAFLIDNDEVSFNYTLQNGDFKPLSKEDEDNTALFVLKSLTDEISFSTDSETLVSTFHVKTKFTVQRTVRYQEIKKNVFKY